MEASSRSSRAGGTIIDDGARGTLQRRGAPGLVLAGKYELLSEIGRGGMGSVWRAEQLEWRAPVAVKLMTLADTPLARERFLREVRLAAALRSPHVVQVLDHGVDEATQLPFIAMELLEGETLSARIRRLGELAPSEVLTIVTHVARALTRAAELGVVHRDLKPDNVYLVANDDEPVIKVLDFGIAKWFDAPELTPEVATAEGRTIGTPWYMSPEQLRASSDLDHRCDLWSLAVIACECLTGVRPFAAADFPALAVLLCGNLPRPIPSRLGPVPAGFDAWFAKATARNIEHRFQTAQELVDALRPLCGAPRSERVAVARQKPSPAEVPTATAVSRTHEGTVMPFLRRRPKLFAALLGATLLSAATNVLLVVYRRSKDAHEHASTEPPEPAQPALIQPLHPTTAAAVVATPSAPAPAPAPEPSSSVATPTLRDEAAPQPAVADSVELAPLDTKRAPKKEKRRRAKRKAQQVSSVPAEQTIDGDRGIRTSF